MLRLYNGEGFTAIIILKHLDFLKMRKATVWWRDSSDLEFPN